MPSGTLRLLMVLPFAMPLALQAQPHHYISLYAPESPAIDGKLDEAAWQDTPWTTDFIDIQGAGHSAPRFRTRAKMRWDSVAFYIAAELEEPDVWATVRERDAVIFQDNDFEVFIDPDGDTHHYYELEVNAFGTVWDLLLTKPYRDGGRPVDAWDIPGLHVGVDVQGTLNQPGDVDTGWTVELAIPWQAFQSRHRRPRPPQPSEQWRLNFSRVEWQVEVRDGQYHRRQDPATGKLLHEDNWVWTPQDRVNMHRPEHWGYVQFSAATTLEAAEAFAPDPNAAIKKALRGIYYRQWAYRRKHGAYAKELEALAEDFGRVPGTSFTPTLYVTPSLFEVIAPGVDGSTVHIRHDGKVWTTAQQ